MRKRSLISIGVSVLLGACIQAPRSTAPASAIDLSAPAEGQLGMVSSAHPIATQAGLDILKQGGNAFDATVAVASTLNVVEPMMSGAGGYGTILIYDAQTQLIRFLDSSGKIPTAVDSDVFRVPNPDHLDNRRGPKAVSTPGNVNAWRALSDTYGRLMWATLFETAIATAHEGYVLDERTARIIRAAWKDFPKEARPIYGHKGDPLTTGEPLVQKNLAESLRRIATEGPAALYGGSIGEAIDGEMHRTGGFLSLADLSSDIAEWWEPIHITYRGLEVYTASPPSTAFPSLIRLGLMSQFDLSPEDHNTADMLHRFCESTKHAFWCRLSYAGDPDVTPPPLDHLLSENYWADQVAGFDSESAEPFVYPGATPNPDQHTTHFVVADRWGNIVSATQTLGNAFGSRIMAPGTGIWLNNSLSYCTFEPKGNPMDAHAGRRKLSGDCPTFIMRDGKPWVAIGTPGGHTIGQTVPQMVMNLVDFGFNIRGAIAAPRISFIEPDIILVEPGIDPAVISNLEARGHKIEVLPRLALGNAHGLTIQYHRNGNPVRFTGAADPRGVGLAQGY
ncbi:MAG: gamma-glutamyltransferase [bacterium]|nr:gamma-glutamyltransferase [bacterium]